MAANAPKKSGRPPKGDAVMIQLAVRFPPEVVEQVDEIIAERHGATERTAVIRELVAAGLLARARKR